MEPIRRIDRDRGSLPVDAVLRVERAGRDDREQERKRREQAEPQPREVTPDADGHVDVLA